MISSPFSKPFESLFDAKKFRAQQICKIKKLR